MRYQVAANDGCLDSSYWCETCDASRVSMKAWELEEGFSIGELQNYDGYAERAMKGDVASYVIRVPGDGSEDLAYIRRNFERIPDFMWEPIARVMEMAEWWIEERRAQQPGAGRGEVG
jgi:hypothetical protein